MTTFVRPMTELELIASAKAGNKRAMKAMIQKYEPLIHKTAKKYGWMAPNNSYEDLIQEGRIGIFKAVKKFQPERGYAFMTLAFPCVRGAVQGLARKENRHPKFTASYESITRSMVLEDPTQEIELKMDLPKVKILEMMEKICGGLESKRAQILCDKFGLFGHEELRNCEIAQKHDISKQAVYSYIVKFTSRASKLYPELEVFV